MNAKHPKPSLDDLQRAATQHDEAPPPADARDASDRPGVLTGASTCIVGVVMVALSVVVLVDTRGLRAGNEPLGPAFFPTLVAAGLALVGIWLAASEWRYLVGALRSVSEWSLDVRRIASIGVVLVTLVLAALLMPVAGFWLVSTVIYSVGALCLQAPLSWRIPAVGATLAGLIVLVFDRFIDLSLPAGPWGF